MSFVFDDPADHAWGGEAVAIAGMPVGELSSVGWSDRAGACVGLGYVRGDMALQAHAGTPVSVDLWGRAVGATAWDRWVAPSHRQLGFLAGQGIVAADVKAAFVDDINAIFRTQA